MHVLLSIISLWSHLHFEELMLAKACVSIFLLYHHMAYYNWCTFDALIIVHMPESQPVWILFFINFVKFPKSFWKLYWVCPHIVWLGGGWKGRKMSKFRYLATLLVFEIVLFYYVSKRIDAVSCNGISYVSTYLRSVVDYFTSEIRPFTTFVTLIKLE